MTRQHQRIAIDAARRARPARSGCAPWRDSRTGRPAAATLERPAWPSAQQARPACGGIAAPGRRHSRTRDRHLPPSHAKRPGRGQGSRQHDREPALRRVKASPDRAVIPRLRAWSRAAVRTMLVRCGQRRIGEAHGISREMRGDDHCTLRHLALADHARSWSPPPRSGSAAGPRPRRVYWIEARPQEGGRIVLVRAGPTAGAPTYAGALQRPHARARIWRRRLAGPGRRVVAVNFADQRLYRLTRGEPRRALTPESGASCATPISSRIRPAPHPRGARGPSRRAASRSTASSPLGLDGEDDGRVLVAGHDFFSSPRLSPDGRRLAWLSWDHPDMPWDGTELWSGRDRRGRRSRRGRQVAGGARESIVQPEWSPDGQLYFVSDRSGWWNLYRLGDGGPKPSARCLPNLPDRPGRSAAAGTVSWRRTTLLPATARTAAGIWRASRSQRPADRLDLPYTSFSGIGVPGGRAVLRAGAPDRPAAIVQLDPSSGAIERALHGRRGAGRRRPISPGRRRSSSRRRAGDRPCLLLPADQSRFTAPAGRAAAAARQEPRRPDRQHLERAAPANQYWTSRGFAVCDVNYGGSTGYGRAYRERLNGRWGVVDVEDCVNAARFLVADGRRTRAAWRSPAAAPAATRRSAR